MKNIEGIFNAARGKQAPASAPPVKTSLRGNPTGDAEVLKRELEPRRGDPDRIAQIEKRAKEIQEQDRLSKIPVTNAVWSAVARLAYPDGLDDVAAVQALLARSKVLVATMNDCTPRAARDAYRKQQADMQKDLVDGKPLPEDAFAKADFEEDFARKMQAAKLARRELDRLAQPHVRKFYRKVADAAEAEAAKLEKSERKAAEQFGATFSPSFTVWQLRGLVYRARRHADGFSNLNSIGQILEYLK